MIELRHSVKDLDTRVNFQRIRLWMEEIERRIAGLSGQGDRRPIVNTASFGLGRGVLYGLNSSGEIAEAVSTTSSATYIRALWASEAFVQPGANFTPPPFGQPAVLVWDGTGTPGPGDNLFLSTVAGKVTPTRPSGGNRVQWIAVALEEPDSDGLIESYYLLQAVATS